MRYDINNPDRYKLFGRGFFLVRRPLLCLYLPRRGPGVPLKSHLFNLRYEEGRGQVGSALAGFSLVS
jgi:hypothetical protein